MPTRGVRGAISADSNTADAIEAATAELLEAMVDHNDINVADIASCSLTTTADLNATFPAVAARKLGWHHVPLLCAHEMDVPGALSQCIRVMILLNTTKKQEEIKHVYLKEAVSLRPDV